MDIPLFVSKDIYTYTKKYHFSFNEKYYNLDFKYDKNVLFLTSNFLPIITGNEKFPSSMLQTCVKEKEYLKSIKKLSGSFYCIGRYWPTNIYHSFYQCFGSFLLAIEFMFDFTDVYVLGPNLNICPFIKPLLQLYPNIQYYEAPQNEIILCENVIRSNQLYTPWDTDHIIDKLVLNSFDNLSKKIEFKKNCFEYIYISRNSDAKNNRKIINEEELVEILNRFGFIKINLSSFSIIEQINIFKNAKFIIAPHGAGLTHLLFSNKGTKVIELFPYGYIPQCFATIAISRGCKYCGIVNCSTSAHQNADMYVDIELLIDIIKNDIFFSYNIETYISSKTIKTSFINNLKSNDNHVLFDKDIDNSIIKKFLSSNSLYKELHELEMQ